MNYFELVKRLSEYGADAPSAEAALIISHFTGKSFDRCLLMSGDPVPAEAESVIEQRKSGIPLQYILGEAWFFGDRYIVSPDCLIPQPDTEHVVNIALGKIKSGMRLLDLCTGSGCIAISILKRCDCVGTAVDISRPALDIAAKNRELHALESRLELVRLDVFDIKSLKPFAEDADIITSNPPYIAANVIPSLSREVRSEPMQALNGGEDGMDFYRYYINEVLPLMKKGALLILEIGYDQWEKIAALCAKSGRTVKFHRDFGNNVRVAEIVV